VQGLSLDEIMVDIGSGIFKNSMAYVALSRAKLSENVFLIKFDKTKFCCDENAVNE
jgi:ATP-dependent exoDNAse (exonuclease V) alpha subunit